MSCRSNQCGADGRDVPPSSKRRKRDTNAINIASYEDEDENVDEVAEMLLQAPPRQYRTTSQSIIISDEKGDEFEETDEDEIVDEFAEMLLQAPPRQYRTTSQSIIISDENISDEKADEFEEKDIVFMIDEDDSNGENIATIVDDVQVEHKTDHVKATRTRRKDGHMKTDFEKGSESVFKCEKCDDIGSMANIKRHQCNLSALKKTFDKNSTHYEAIKIRAHKQYLQSCLKTEHKVFTLGKLRDAVTRQHLLKLYGCIVIHGFIQHTLQVITLDNVGQFVLKKTNPLLVIDQPVVKKAMSFCAKDHKIRDRTSDLYNFHHDHFLSVIPKGQLPILEHISSTSLQNAARQTSVNYQTMMASQIWKRTRYWMLRELDELVLTDPTFQLILPSQRIKLLSDHIRPWLFKNLTNDVPKQLWTSEKAYEHFLSAIPDSISANIWNLIWLTMSSCFINPILSVLHVLEFNQKEKEKQLMKDKMDALQDGDDDDDDDDDGTTDDDDDGEEKNVDKDAAFLACRRGEWLFAILKRIEQLQEIARGRWSKIIPNDQKKRPNFKLHNVFPLCGYVPSAIKSGSAMLSAFILDEHKKQQKLEDDKPESKKKKAEQVKLRKQLAYKLKKESGQLNVQVVTKQSHKPTHPKPKRKSYKTQPILKFHHLFRFHEKFWIDRLKRKCVTQFTTDGYSVSFGHSSIVSKKRKPQRTPEQWKSEKERSKKVGYIDNETTQTLTAKGITGVITIDTNRKNFLVATYRPLEKLTQLVDDKTVYNEVRPKDPKDPTHCPTHRLSDKSNPVLRQRRKQEKDIVIRITKSEYRHVRKIKQHNQTRESLIRQYKQDKIIGNNAVDIFANPPTLAGSSSDNMTKHLTYLRNNNWLKDTLEFYNNPIFRRQRMESYSASQQFYRYVQTKIYKTLKQAGVVHQQPNSYPSPSPTESRLLILLGDGDFQHNSKGHLSMPSGWRLFKELRHLGEHIMWINEHCTSKCCSECGADMEAAITERRITEESRQPGGRKNRRGKLKNSYLKKLPKPPRTKQPFVDPDQPDPLVHPTFPRSSEPKLSCRQRFAHLSSQSTNPSIPHHDHKTISSPSDRVLSRWGLRVCLSEACHNRLWCRDLNACRNMLSIAKWILTHPESEHKAPVYLRRQPKKDLEIKEKKKPSLTQTSEPLTLKKRKR